MWAQATPFRGGGQFLGPATILWQWGGRETSGVCLSCQPLLHTLDLITSLSGIKRLWSDAPTLYPLLFLGITSAGSPVCAPSPLSCLLGSKRAGFCGLLSLGNTAYSISVWEIHGDYWLGAWRKNSKRSNIKWSKFTAFKAGVSPSYATEDP